MPELGGQRLDVALSDLRRIGVAEEDVEVVSGGTFGVLDQSNWTVCEQLPGAGSDDTSTVRLVVDRTCDLDAEPATDGAASEPAASTVKPETQPSSDEPSEKEATFVMPQLVGQNLQLAQDTLQAKGSFLLDQQDASGLNRLQLLDSNWRVCAQQPKPGRTVSVDYIITLAAAKIGEAC
jgi:hypothetical protein